MRRVLVPAPSDVKVVAVEAAAHNAEHPGAPIQSWWPYVFAAGLGGVLAALLLALLVRAAG